MADHSRQMLLGWSYMDYIPTPTQSISIWPELDLVAAFLPDYMTWA